MSTLYHYIVFFSGYGHIPTKFNILKLASFSNWSTNFILTRCNQLLKYEKNDWIRRFISYVPKTFLFSFNSYRKPNQLMFQCQKVEWLKNKNEVVIFSSNFSIVRALAAVTSHVGNHNRTLRKRTSTEATFFFVLTGMNLLF